MRILHITNEFSKKNYSIASLIIHISKLFKKNHDQNVNIVTSKIDKNLFSEKNIELVNFSSWINFFAKSEETKRKIKNNDVVHIHGIWAPIQLFSIIYCNNINKTFIIHPHGMLLKEALSSAGRIKLSFKILTLIFLKFFLRKNVFFISITRQESQAIKKFFPSAVLKEIPNPIPFEIFDSEIKNKLKQIIYFGRIHPHKNLELLIQGFINAKLDKEWKLKIYGIRDDEKYFDKLQKIIKNYDNINIYEPVFGQERQNIMSSSWANILVSKSEVLSLSILESSYFGLPSITNKNIELNEFKECVVLTSLNINELTNKIQDISRWSLEDRIEKEKKIKSISRAKILNLETPNWDSLVEKGLSPDSYVFNQCSETVNGVNNEIPVYMGIGVDAPSYNSVQAKCTPEIVYESVINSFNAGASGVIYSPNYNFMKFSNLDGSVKALKELDI